MSAELEVIRQALDDVRGLDDVIGATVVARAGPFIMGDAPHQDDPQAFASMAAVMLGAAERTSMDFGTPLGRVEIDLGGKGLIITGAGPRHVLVVWVSEDAERDSTMRSVDRIVSRSF